MIDFVSIKRGNQIRYKGKSLAFGGQYSVYDIESTYKEIEMCPKEDRGKLIIIEFMNNGTPMFFPLDSLKANEWEMV